MLGNDGLYFFNHLEVLVAVVSSDDLLTWQHEQACNEFDKAIVELPASYSLKGVVYFGFFDDEGDFKLFYITDKKVGETLFLEGVDKAESDLRTVTIIKDKRPHNVTADQALTVALEGSGYQVGTVSNLPQVRSLSYYYISPREALVKLVETFQCEFRVRYVFNQNRISHRYIDLSHRFGKSSGKQFVHGQNALEIIQEESGDSVITALIGRGKGQELDSGGYGRRIEFTDVVWSKASGKPVDKPAGQNYVVSEEARRLYGLSQDGNLKHRWGVFVDEDIEDPEQLLERTYAELNRLSYPTRVYRTRVLHLGYEARLGDRVAIIHDGIGIAIEARLFKLVRDRLNPDLSTVEIGDYEVLKASQSRSSFEGQRLQQTLDERLSPYAQELQRFYERVETEKERRNAEIEEQFRLARLDFDNYKELAETKTNDLKDELTSQINADLRPLADEAKRLADSAVSDLERQRQELEAVRSSVGSAKAEAIREATNQLNTARQELAGLVDGAKREARELVDGLSVGGRNYLPYGKAFWEVGNIYSDGITTNDFETYFRRTKTYIVVSEGDYLLNAKGSYGIAIYFYNSENRKVTYTGTNSHDGNFWYVGSAFPIKIKIPAGVVKIKVAFRSNLTPRFTDDESFENALKGMKFEKGNVGTDWSPAPEDYSHTLEQLDNGYREKFRVIESNDTERRTFQTEIEKKVDGFRTSISSLNEKFDSEGNLTELTRYKNDRQETDRLISQSLSELVTYKDGESDRSRAYFEASRDETARQLREERRLITEHYVVKSHYEEDARAITRRFESLSVGGVNLIRGSRDFTGSNWYRYSDQIWRLDGEHQGAGVLVWQSGPKSSPIAMYQVEAGKTYTFSAWFKKDTAGTVFFYLYDNHSTDMRADVNREHQLTTSGGQFERYQLTFKVTRSGLMKARFAISPSEESGLSVAGFQLEEGNLPSPYRPNEEDFRSEFATYKQGIGVQLATLTKDLGDKVSSTTFNQTADEIKQSVSTLDGQVMKSSNFTIDANGLVLQSGREFNGSTITSLLTVNPDNIKAITDKMIITPRHENLFANLVFDKDLSNRAEFYTPFIDGSPQDLDFFCKFDLTRHSVRGAVAIRFQIKYQDATVDYYNITIRTEQTVGRKTGEFSFKGIVLPKRVAAFKMGLNSPSDRTTFHNVEVYIKKSASLIVDGSITASQIASGAIETGHMKAGSVTAAILSADAVTASKLKVDVAMINKLTANNLLAINVTTSEVFATQVQAVDLSASRIRSGVLASRNGATSFNLDTGELLFYTDSPAIKRVTQGYPNQFVKFATGYSYQDNREVGVTVIGSNRDGSENANNGTFAGIRIWNGSNLDQVDIVGDTVRLASSAFENQDGWEIKTTPNQLSIDARRAQDRPTSVLNIGDVRLFENNTTYISLRNTINLIVDNLDLLHKNKETKHKYYYTLPSKI